MGLINNKRKINLLAVIAALGLQSSLNTVQAQNTDKVHLGFFYPISTHGTHAPLDTNTFSLHAIAGVSAEEKGLAIAGFSNVVKHNVKGLAIAGFSNHIGNHVEGMAFAGFCNTYKSGKGGQIAGFSNVAANSVEGIQYAGFLNKAGDLKGMQVSGFSNEAKNVIGAQVSGFVNTANKVTGSQIAGFTNVSSASVTGSQLAGFVNVSRGAVQTQVAGFINVAKKVKGAQIAGFINIADSSDCPIGIINIIKNGEKSIGISIDETQTTLLSFRSGGKVLYGILAAGYNLKNGEEVYAAEVGLGAHLLRTNTFRLNTEIATLCLESFKWGEYFKSSFRLMPTVTIAKHFEIFGGPTLNLVNTTTSEGKNMVNHYFYKHQNKWSNDYQGLYLGYIAGINIKF